MTSIAAVFPLPTLADAALPKVGGAGGGDGFAPVFAALLTLGDPVAPPVPDAPATVAPVQPALAEPGTALPMFGNDTGNPLPPDPAHPAAVAPQPTPPEVCPTTITHVDDQPRSGAVDRPTVPADVVPVAAQIRRVATVREAPAGDPTPDRNAVPVTSGPSAPAEAADTPGVDAPPPPTHFAQPRPAPVAPDPGPVDASPPSTPDMLPERRSSSKQSNTVAPNHGAVPARAGAASPGLGVLPSYVGAVSTDPRPVPLHPRAVPSHSHAEGSADSAQAAEELIQTAIATPDPVPPTVPLAPAPTPTPPADVSPVPIEPRTGSPSSVAPKPRTDFATAVARRSSVVPSSPRPPVGDTTPRTIDSDELAPDQIAIGAGPAATATPDTDPPAIVDPRTDAPPSVQLAEGTAAVQASAPQRERIEPVAAAIAPVVTPVVEAPSHPARTAAVASTPRAAAVAPVITAFVAPASPDRASKHVAERQSSARAARLIDAPQTTPEGQSRAPAPPVPDVDGGRFAPTAALRALATTPLPAATPLAPVAAPATAAVRTTRETPVDAAERHLDPTTPQPAPSARAPTQPALAISESFGAALHRAVVAERRPRRDDVTAIAGLTAAMPLATPATAPVDTNRADWPATMLTRIEQLRDQLSAPGTPVDTRIRLHPDALGAVDVTLRQDAAGTHVRLHAAEPAARALLADAQPQLQTLAEQRGLRLAGTELSGGQTGTGQGWTGDRRQPAAQTSPPARRPAPATDLGADDPADTRLA